MKRIDRIFGIEVRDEKQRHKLSIKMRFKLLFWNIPQSLSKKILTTSFPLRLLSFGNIILLPLINLNYDDFFMVLSSPFCI